MNQKETSTILRILIPVKRPRMPPKTELDARGELNSELALPNPDSLSKKLSLLLLTVTDTVSVASLNVTSAL